MSSSWCELPYLIFQIQVNPISTRAGGLYPLKSCILAEYLNSKNLNCQIPWRVLDRDRNIISWTLFGLLMKRQLRQWLSNVCFSVLLFSHSKTYKACSCGFSPILSILYPYICILFISFIEDNILIKWMWSKIWINWDKLKKQFYPNVALIFSS